MNDITAPAIELRGLRKSFGAVRAVDGLDLVVQPGETVAFLGPNGAGKSTTIDLLLGLQGPDAGTVQVLGTTPAEAIAAGHVAAVLQSGGLLRDLTVRETVELVSSFYAAPRSSDEVLACAGIADLSGRLVGKCSGGEQQRLRFALALLPDPQVLVLDEPTVGMDVPGRHDFWRAVCAEAGRTVLFATHYLDEAEAHASRIVLVGHGRVVADGSADEVRALAGSLVGQTPEPLTLEDAFLALTTNPRRDH
jgi:ABC-2 type transport system ATP-binding protein